MKSDAIKVIHVSGSVSREAGGLFESVRHLSQETSKHGIDLSVLSIEDAYTHEDLAKWKPIPVHVFPSLGPRRFAWCPGMARHLMVEKPEIVHLHGVWQYPTVAVLRWARRTGKPYIVSPHGMLEPWALRRSAYRKAMANWLFQNSCLVGAACLRATAESEVESVRQIGLRNPVALIANGVPFPRELPPRPAPVAGRRKRALFISRIHPKKGLINLVNAWAKIRQTEPGRRASDEWELALVGPDEGGHLAEVMAAVQAQGLGDRISYMGEVWNEEAKRECYTQADLFVLPSFSENFGLVIAEALSCGVPVITTRATPWEELESHRCGWWIETGEAPLVQALEKALATPVATLREMGGRGRELIEAKYSWRKPGAQMAEVYEWLAGRRGRPECVA